MGTLMRVLPPEGAGFDIAPWQNARLLLFIMYGVGIVWSDSLVTEYG